jgi:hypothetical protein
MAIRRLATGRQIIQALERAEERIIKLRDLAVEGYEPFLSIVKCDEGVHYTQTTAGCETAMQLIDKKLDSYEDKEKNLLGIPQPGIIGQAAAQEFEYSHPGDVKVDEEARAVIVDIYALTGKRKEATGLIGFGAFPFEYANPITMSIDTKVTLFNVVIAQIPINRAQGDLAEPLRVIEQEKNMLAEEMDRKYGKYSRSEEKILQEAGNEYDQAELAFREGQRAACRAEWKARENPLNEERDAILRRATLQFRTTYDPTTKRFATLDGIVSCDVWMW